MLIALIFILLLPVLYLVLRILLILSVNKWAKTDCNIYSFKILKKKYGASDTPLYPEYASDNYILVKYKYIVEGREYVSQRISLDLVDKGYSPVEIEHDPFINYLKNKKCHAFYFKYWPKLSVLKIEKSHIGFNFAMLLIYVSVVLTSWAIVVSIS